MNNNLSIDDLEKEIITLKQEQKYKECLSLIENLIILKAQKYGKTSETFLKTAKDLCIVCNEIALTYLDLSFNEREEGLKYLLKAEMLFKNNKELLNMCYNNIGCYYRL